MNDTLDITKMIQNILNIVKILLRIVTSNVGYT